MKKTIVLLLVLCLVFQIVAPFSYAANVETVNAFNYLKNVTIVGGDKINGVYYYQPSTSDRYNFVYDPQYPNEVVIMYTTNGMTAILNLNQTGTTPYTFYLAVYDGKNLDVSGLAEVYPEKVNPNLTAITYQAHNFPSSNLYLYRELGASCLLQLVGFTEFVLENTVYCIREFGFTAMASDDVHLTVQDLFFHPEGCMMTDGETKELLLTIYPYIAAEENAVSWRSSNRNVATVTSSGIVRAVGKGETTITASAGGKSTTCNVVVLDDRDIQVRSEAYQYLKEIAIEYGESDGGFHMLQLFQDEPYWISYDETDPTSIRLHYSTNEQSASLRIDENDINSYRLFVEKGTGTAFAEIVPNIFTFDTDFVLFSWIDGITSAEQHVSTEESGALMLKDMLTNVDFYLYGTPYCVSNFGFSNVIENDAHKLTTGIEIIPKKITLRVGESKSVYVSVNPETMENEYIWMIEDPEIADIEDGVIRAYKVGRTTISVCSGSKVAECIVDVIDCDVTVSTVNGAQIRTGGVQGLRFISSIDKTVDFDRVVEYGTVLIPSADITDISELVIDATLNGHKVAKVKANYIYNETDDAVTFTAVITNIAAKNYAREYTARAYAILDDGTVVYADTGASRSVYAVAKRGLENPNESDANKEIFQGIVDTVEGGN